MGRRKEELKVLLWLSVRLIVSGFGIAAVSMFALESDAVPPIVAFFFVYIVGSVGWIAICVYLFFTFSDKMKAVDKEFRPWAYYIAENKQKHE